MNDVDNSLGNRISDLLIYNQMSQKELAKLLRTTPASISRYIKGIRIPNSIIISKMAKILNVSSDYLLYGEQGSADPEIDYHKTLYFIQKNTKTWTENQKKRLIVELLDLKGETNETR